MDITLALIEEFIERTRISDKGFCDLCGKSRSWLSKIRGKMKSKNDVLIFQ